MSKSYHFIRHIIQFALLAIFSCITLMVQSQDPMPIIEKCIKAHGGKKYNKLDVQFDFRDHTYVYHRNKGSFRYERINSSTGFHDILTNSGLERFQDGEKIELNDADERKYSRSVNSVHYFAFLPYFLQDKAVNPTYLGEVQIHDQSYHKIKVTFDAEGGGEDFDDIFVYWIHSENYTMDYLGYSYEVDGGGVRFRSSYNKRKVNGILFQDYINYKHDKDTDVTILDMLYEDDELEELSKIELVDIHSK